MDNTAIVESDSTSEVDDQTKAWESDPRPVTTQPVALDDGLEDQPVECGIGHRMEASRSVLVLALDEECVFAGLQGGDIVVCPPCIESTSMEDSKLTSIGMVTGNV